VALGAQPNPVKSLFLKRGYCWHAQAAQAERCGDGTLASVLGDGARSSYLRGVGADCFCGGARRELPSGAPGLVGGPHGDAADGLTPRSIQATTLPSSFSWDGDVRRRIMRGGDLGNCPPKDTCSGAALPLTLSDASCSGCRFIPGRGRWYCGADQMGVQALPAKAAAGIEGF